jgi:hypothetical protein
MKIIIPTFERLLEKFNLDIEGQKKLIEILLIIGSIIVALKLPDSMIWIFMLFVLMAILYYITAKNNSKPDRLLPLAVSCTFTGIVTTILFMNVNTPIFLLYIKLIMFAIYYVVFTLIIWVALIRR